MNYKLYKIDDINKTVYLIKENDITSNEKLLNNASDYERILKYANENNYKIELYEKTENYEDVFSLKKHL